MPGESPSVFDAVPVRGEPLRALLDWLGIRRVSAPQRVVSLRGALPHENSPHCGPLLLPASCLPRRLRPLSLDDRPRLRRVLSDWLGRQLDSQLCGPARLPPRFELPPFFSGALRLSKSLRRFLLDWSGTWLPCARPAGPPPYALLSARFFGAFARAV